MIDSFPNGLFEKSRDRMPFHRFERGFSPVWNGLMMPV